MSTLPQWAAQCSAVAPSDSGAFTLAPCRIRPRRAAKSLCLAASTTRTSAGAALSELPKRAQMNPNARPFFNVANIRSLRQQSYSIRGILLDILYTAKGHTHRYGAEMTNVRLLTVVAGMVGGGA